MNRLLMHTLLLLFLLSIVFTFTSCGDNNTNNENDSDLLGTLADMSASENFSWKTTTKYSFTTGILLQDKGVGPATITVSTYDEATKKAGKRILKVVVQKGDPLNITFSLPEIETKVVIRGTYMGKEKEMIVDVDKLSSLQKFDIYTGERPGTNPEADSVEEVLK